MKSRKFFMFFVTILILSLTLSACSRTTGEQPVDEQPVGGTVPTSQPQETGGGGRAPEFYTEEFEGDVANWEWELASGNQDDLEIYTENSAAVYKINNANTGTYTLYTPHTYTDVVLTAQVKNNGVNSYYYSLACRWTDDGHYEAVITGGGLYWINGYGGGVGSELASGGSNDIKAGKNTNEYVFSCVGNTLILYVNGKQVERVVDDFFGLTEGMVGFGVSAQDAWPVEIAVQSFDISEP